MIPSSEGKNDMGGTERWYIFFVYIVDTILILKSLDEHLKHIRLVLSFLCDVQETLGMKRIDFLPA